MKGRAVCGPVLISRILDFLVLQCVDTASCVRPYAAALWLSTRLGCLYHHMIVLIVFCNLLSAEGKETPCPPCQKLSRNSLNSVYVLNDRPVPGPTAAGCWRAPLPLQMPLQCSARRWQRWWFLQPPAPPMSPSC